MVRAQSAICAEGERFGIFLTLILAEGETAGGQNAAAVVRATAAALPGLTIKTAAKTGTPSLVSAMGFGAEVWPRLFGLTPAPAGLEPFAALKDGTRTAPATPADLFIHIHATRHDANFALAREVMRRLGKSVRLVEEVHGFAYLDGRDLTGFVDGTENPKGEDRPSVALIGDEDPANAGGSYVSIQRYVHNLDLWETQHLSEQEKAVGRTKDEDVELDDDEKPPSAHIARVVIEEEGEELEIIRHSLPYGTTTTHGLYFVSYCRSPVPFRRMLERMICRDSDGHADRLLDFTTPVTGAAFFAPSADFLEALALSSPPHR